MDLEQAMAGVADRLAASGERVAVDPRDVNPPCLLLAPPVARFRFGAAAFDAEWSVWAVAGDAGRRQALGVLSGLITAATTALAGRPVVGRPADLTLPDGGVVPAYVLTWTERTKETP